MIYFLLAVLFTVALYLIIPSFPKYGVNSFHGIVFNYYACVATGLVLTPDIQTFTKLDWTSTGSILTLLLGIIFVVAFLFIGITAQKVSVSASSLAANMSLVIPVVFGLFVFQNNHKDFTVFNYLGLFLALAALALGSIQKKEKNNETGTSKISSALWIFPVLTFLASGSNNTLINYLTSRYYTPDQSTVFMIVACVGAILSGTLILIFRRITKNEKVEFRSVIGGLILGVPNFLSLYFLLKALASFGNSAAYVFPIFNILTMLASSLAAYLIFNEKISNINRAGLFLAIVAVVLISYQELGF